MAIRYISSKTTYFYTNANNNDRDFVLIYGDEVDTQNHQNNGRDQVIYRGRFGWVRSDRLMLNHPMEIYFIDVGQGDATFIVTPANRKILMDGGKGNEAFQFLVWKYRLDAQNPIPVDIDLLVVSHTDEDHLEGLIAIVQHPLIRVREIVHSGIAKYSAGFDETLGDLINSGGNDYLITRHNTIAELANRNLTDTISSWQIALQNEQNLNYRAVDVTTGQINIGDPSITLHVIGPRLENIPNHPNPVYRWLSNSSQTVNGHSVNLRLDMGNFRMLLSGDINERAERYYMQNPAFSAAVDAHVFKAPHHGSHEFDFQFLEAVHPQITVVSSGESPDHGHPRANFLGSVGKASRSDEPLLFSTELGAMFAVDQDAEAVDADDDPDPVNPAMLGQARRRFKKRLNGLINVRTDGNTIYCARRVAASYQFVTHEQPIQARD